MHTYPKTRSEICEKLIPGDTFPGVADKIAPEKHVLFWAMPPAVISGGQGFSHCNSQTRGLLVQLTHLMDPSMPRL